MRIGIDARGLRGPRTGMENAAWYSLEHLAPWVRSHSMLLYDHREGSTGTLEGLPGQYRPGKAPGLGRCPGPVWLQLVLPRLLRADRIELYHSWYQAVPWLGDTKKVVTVHDLVPFLWPQTQTRSQTLLSRCQLRI